MAPPRVDVLIVDDNPAVCSVLGVLFELEGWTVATAEGPEAALDAVRRGVGVVVQDMNFSRNTTSGEEGVALFRSIRALDPQVPVVLLTAWTCLETAVALVREGADDYLAKPWDDAKLVAKLAALLRTRTGPAATPGVPPDADLCGLVYASAEMHALVRLALRVAPSEAPVLITGPNGSGKERIAEIVQRNSGRRAGPFVRVNLGAVPDELFEAELFGAEKGAFTGAAARRIGRYEAADGGTLFLDELGNLSPAAQAKLLRVLQSGEFERLGSSHTRRASVRVIAATNADLRAEIAAQRFREDLYYRLAVVELELLPLAERPDDIERLAEHFLACHAEGPAPRLSAAAEQALRAHDWPGNVRELDNRIHRALLVHEGRELEPRDLDLDLDLGGAASGRAPAAQPRELSLSPSELAAREPIEAALRRHGGVVAAAAAELGLSRQALYRRMKKLGLSVQRKLEG